MQDEGRGVGVDERQLAVAPLHPDRLGEDLGHGVDAEQVAAYAAGIAGGGSITGPASRTASRAIAPSDIESAPGRPMPLMSATAPTRSFGSTQTLDRNPSRLPVLHPDHVVLAHAVPPEPNAWVHSSSPR